jgi:hypothetical protein
VSSRFDTHPLHHSHSRHWLGHTVNAAVTAAFLVLLHSSALWPRAACCVASALPAYATISDETRISSEEAAEETVAEVAHSHVIAALVLGRVTVVVTPTAAPLLCAAPLSGRYVHR